MEKEYRRRTQPEAASMLESDVQCEELFSGSKEAIVCLLCLELLGKINSEERCWGLIKLQLGMTDAVLVDNGYHRYVQIRS